MPANSKKAHHVIMLEYRRKKPIFQHYCNRCVFLGSSYETDMYWCMENVRDYPHVCIRIGNHPKSCITIKINEAPEEEYCEIFNEAKRLIALFGLPEDCLRVSVYTG